MAERVPAPTELDKTNWNSDGVTYPSTDPGAPKRATGFKPKDVPVAGPGDILPANDHNWLWNLSMQVHTWIKQFIPREWRYLPEAIAAASTRDLLRVVPPSAGNLYRLQQIFSKNSTGATGGNPASICTDGEQVYYVGGAIGQSLIGASPNDLSEVWEDGGLTQYSAVCVDGAYVYAMSTLVGEPGLYKRSRTTGGAVSNGGTENGCTKLRVNGIYAVGIRPNSSTSKLVFWTCGSGAAAPTETGTVSPTVLNGVAIDSDQAYVGGTRNTNDVWAYTLSTRANAWAVTLDANAPTVNDICADGDRVYVCTDQFATAAGPNKSLFCLDRLTGALIWSADYANLDACCVDDHYLYVTTDGGVLYQLDPFTGYSVATQTAMAAIGQLCCDGLSIYGQDGSTATNVRKLSTWIGGTRTFTKMLGQDPNRRPFYHLAIPV